MEEFLKRREKAIVAENEAFTREVAAYEELVRLRQHHSRNSPVVQAAVGNLQVQRQSLQQARVAGRLSLPGQYISPGPLQLDF
jgi:hypothetical protein